MEEATSSTKRMCAYADPFTPMYRDRNDSRSQQKVDVSLPSAHTGVLKT